MIEVFYLIVFSFAQYLMASWFSNWIFDNVVAYNITRSGISSREVAFSDGSEKIQVTIYVYDLPSIRLLRRRKWYTSLQRQLGWIWFLIILTASILILPNLLLAISAFLEGSAIVTVFGLFGAIFNFLGIGSAIVGGSKIMHLDTTSKTSVL